ncbi:MAG: hypothetical protein ABSE57_24740 [Bryobacteraceae bacterium]|jgi:hypothetical protein
MEEHVISRYDRQRGGLQQGNALFVPRPATIKNTEPITGETETFVIETARHEEQGDYIFIERLDKSGTAIRIVLPPRVANAIAAQRDSLTKRRRSITSRAAAKSRMERGELPGFMRKRAS